MSTFRKDLVAALIIDLQGASEDIGEQRASLKHFKNSQEQYIIQAEAVNTAFNRTAFAMSKLCDEIGIRRIGDYDIDKDRRPERLYLHANGTVINADVQDSDHGLPYNIEADA